MRESIEAEHVETVREHGKATWYGVVERRPDGTPSVCWNHGKSRHGWFRTLDEARRFMRSEGGGTQIFKLVFPEKESTP